jgi:hypothetical protein
MQRHQQEVFDRLGALTKTKVNWEPSDAARDSAMAKISKEAAFYDRNRSKYRTTITATTTTVKLLLLLLLLLQYCIPLVLLLVLLGYH